VIHQAAQGNADRRSASEEGVDALVGKPQSSSLGRWLKLGHRHLTSPSEESAQHRVKLRSSIMLGFVSFNSLLGGPVAHR